MRITWTRLPNNIQKNLKKKTKEFNESIQTGRVFTQRDKIQLELQCKNWVLKRDQNRVSLKLIRKKVGSLQHKIELGD